MWPALVTNRAMFSEPAMFSTLLLTASSSIPFRLTTSSTTTRFALYASTTAAGRPGPATNLPGAAAAVAPLAVDGEVGVGTTAVASGGVVGGATELDSVEVALGVTGEADDVALAVDSVELSELL